MCNICNHTSMVTMFEMEKMSYRKAERGHLNSSLCLFLTVLKVEMEEKKWFNIYYRSAEKRGDNNCRLGLFRKTVEGVQPKL